MAFASPLIFSAAKGIWHVRGLNSQAKWRLAFFWLLFSVAPGWAAMMAPVTVVDVMMLYTPQAGAGAGGAAVLEAKIDLAVAEANLVFENSRASVRIRLVHRAEIDYEESGTVANDLARLRSPSDGWLDEAHVLRNQHTADLVCLVIETGSDFEFYGLQGPSAANAFSVIRRSYLTGSFFFPVVLSFNFGCQLERPYADSVGAFPFSYGYTARTDSGWFSSIDAFDGTRLPYFSNPDIVLGGTNDIPSFRLGVPEGLSGAANNTKTLNLTAPIVAAFRGTTIATLPPSIQFIGPLGSNTSSIGLIEGTNLTLVVAASDTDGLIHRVDFFQSNESGSPLRLIGTVNSRPYSFVWTNIPAGNHFVIAQAVDDSGATSHTPPIGITVTALPPPNDDFANRTLLSGVGIALTNSNSSATVEPDEPDHDGPPQRSIWWSWMAPASGRATLTSDSGHYFNVYVGSELTTLSSITSGLDSFSFDTTAGTAYAISADGAPGQVTMRLVFSTVQLTGLTDGASIPAGRDVPLSVVTTENDGVITRVEFFVDDVLHSTLTNAPYDFLWTSPAQGFHGLVARAVATGGFVRESPTLHVTVTPPIAPNDNFTNRTIITGTHASLAGSNYGASNEPDEPTAGGSSVWFTWTAPGAGNLRLMAEAEFYFAYLEVFTGETLTNLNQVAASVFRLQPAELRVTPGTAYQIALEESFGDQFGNYQLTLDFEPEPANDHFTNRIPVSGVMASFGGSNAGASREPDEPTHTMITGGKSLWWSWVAPASGMATITVSGNYPLLAVYTGAELSNLTLQADNQGPPNFTPILFHEVRFRVTTGTAYSIALDTWGGVPETIDLGISFEAAPSNDDFVDRIELGGAHVLVSGPTNISLATSEPGEPLTGSGNTVWWTWTPHTNGAVTLTADWLVIGVYTGDVVSSLTEVVSPTGEPTHIFRVTAGTAYQVAAGGREGGGDCPAGCDFRLDFEPTQITITQPPDGSVFYTNEVSLEASVEPSFGSVQRVDYFSVGQDFIGSATNVPYTLPFTGVFEATYGIYARAISTDGRITISDPITVSFRYQRPANDDFADRAILTGSNIIVTASNGGATTEPGEPSHAGTPPNHSLWWSWTAPANGGVTVTLASNPFDTAIQIYTGITLTNLNPIIGNWSNGEVNFNVVAGREYIIAMNAAGGVGPLSFRLVYQAPPLNDDFANQIMLVGTNVTAHSSTVGASKEPDEPNHAGHPGSVRSIWWSWTAPTTGAVIIDSGGSGGIVLMAVYTGTNVSNLTLVANPSPSFAKTLIRFMAQAGMTYHIAADSYFKGLDVVVNLRAIPPPANDLFINRIQLSGSSLSVTGHNYFATREPSEPAQPGFPGGSSVWWTWTPSASGSVRFSVSSGGFAITPLVWIFTGDSITNLVRQVLNVSGDDKWFGVSAGTTYQIQLDGYAGEYADFVLELRGPPMPPPNDRFADRIPITGAPISVSGTTVGATLEPGEPNTLGGSVWWSWTAPASGEAHIFTTGSPHITPFAVFIGNSVTTLTEIARAPFPSPDSVRFPVAAGTTYEIAAVSYLWTEPFVLNVELTPGPTFNDAFADRITLTGLSGVTTGSNIHATLEPGETNLAGGTGRTVWWSWTAPRDGLVTVDLTSSQFTGGPPPGNVQNGGPLVAVYAGLSLGTLQLVASNTTAVTIQLPPFPGQPPGTAIVWRVNGSFDFTAIAGTTYQFAVDGANGSLGEIVLRWSLATWPPSPVNDDFSNRVPLSGTAVDFTASLVGATREPGEPDHAGQPGGRSVWWTWTAPESGPATIVAPEATQSIILAVYTGETLSNLFTVAATVGPTLSFAATAGTTYQFVIDSDGDSPDSLAARLRLGVPPFNDDFANRTGLVGLLATITGDNTIATSEFGEVLPGAASGRTLWWSWTAPSNGTLTINNIGGSLAGAPGLVINPQRPLVHIFSGQSLASQSLIASNYECFLRFMLPDLQPIEFCELFPSISFRMIGGISYQISVDGCKGSSGEFSMDFAFEADPPPPMPPPNDHFADRIVLVGAAVSLTASNGGATTEPGEPLHAGEPGGSSVWWSWTASVSGRARLAVAASFDAVTAVYTGGSLDALTEVAHGGGDVSFDCVAGATYHFAIDGVGGATGEFQLDFTATARPLNDQFADRITLSGSAVAVDGSTEAATREAGEPLHSASTTGASVWYSWTAPASGDVTLAAAGWSVEQPFSVYVGSMLTNQYPIARAPAADGANVARFYAVAGLSYEIAVSDNAGEEGAFTLTINAAPTTPRLQAEASVRLPDGTFLLRIAATNAQSFAIQTSTDLVAWTTLAIDTMQGNVFEFVDAEAMGLSHRFYRVLPLEALFSNGPLRVTHPTAYSGGLFSVEVRGPAGLPFALEGSEDLENWTELATGQIIGDSFSFEDRDAPGFARRFYRAVPLR